MGRLQRVNLSRSTAKDLASGIQELEKRGYELIKQGVEEETVEVYDHVKKRGKSKTHFRLREDKTRHRAVMQRVYYD